MRHLTAAAIICLLLGAAAPSALHAQSGSPDRQCRVRKIYVAGFGDSAEAERFRRELKRQLTGRRFAVVESEEEAEAVLTGVLSFGGSDGNGRLAFERGELRGAGGGRLWQGNFYFERVSRRSFRGGGKVKDAAGKIAANIGGACL
jgi:hypothetical protein